MSEKLLSMRAVRLNNPGDASSLSMEEKLPAPELAPRQVLIQVAYTGVNFVDTYQRSGLYPLPAHTVLGREASGVVVAVGKEVGRFKIGDRVMTCEQGSYADYMVAHEDKVVSVPKELDLKRAAASAMQGLTAHYLICSTYKVSDKDTVLIHAGAGGTGALAIQMAKLKGARVITTVSTEQKAQLAKEAGADHVINYATHDFLDEVMEITDKKGVQVVYDGVGKATWEKSLKCLAPLGMLVLFGNASGPVPAIDPLLLSRHGSLFVTRPTLAHYTLTHEALQARADEVFGWLAADKLKLRIAQQFDLCDIGEAHRCLEGRGALGKVVVAVNPGLE